MECYITNGDVYVMLNKSGQPIACQKTKATVFDPQKACNILNNMPRTMQKFKFRVVEAKKEEPKHVNEMMDSMVHGRPGKKIVCTEKYKVPDCVVSWEQKIASCNGIAKEAEGRKEELVKELSKLDKEQSKILHKIELLPDMNARDGFMQYKEIRTVARKRRVVKDELAIVDLILKSNIQSVASGTISDFVKRLGNRSYQFEEEPYE